MPALCIQPKRMHGRETPLPARLRALRRCPGRRDGKALYVCLYAQGVPCATLLRGVSARRRQAFAAATCVAGDNDRGGMCQKFFGAVRRKSEAIQSGMDADGRAGCRRRADAASCLLWRRSGGLKPSRPQRISPGKCWMPPSVPRMAMLKAGKVGANAAGVLMAAPLPIPRASTNPGAPARNAAFSSFRNGRTNSVRRRCRSCPEHRR